MRFLILLFALIAGIPQVVMAGTPYYSYPDTTTLPDNSRVLIYDPNINPSSARDRNITGAKLKSEIIKSIGDPSDAPLKKQPIATSPYIRQMEVRDSTGKITYYITAGGTMVIGTPTPMTIAYVYPTNGATGVGASSTVPSVSFNKEVTATISGLYIVGSSTAPAAGPVTYTIPATLSANTTYKIRVNLPLIGQDASDMSMTCGVMTDLGNGLCESTFTTGP
jgi:hypothetical protein